VIQTSTNSFKSLIDEYRNNDMIHLRVNLFVDPMHAKIIETNLQDIEREIEKLEVEVNRIKHYYENINSPAAMDSTT